MTTKGGRPYVMDAIRYACGKINRAETDKLLAQQTKDREGQHRAPPSPRIKAARDLFNQRCFKGGGHGNHAGDAIGQLWLLGMLDVGGIDDTLILNAARTWWHGRGIMFKGMDYKTASFERASRTSGSSGKLSKAEREYERYSALLSNAAQYDQDCLCAIMETNIDGDFPGWVSRIIQTEFLKFIRVPLALLACDRDYAMLEAAKRALLVMVGSDFSRRAA